MYGASSTEQSPLLQPPANRDALRRRTLRRQHAKRGLSSGQGERSVFNNLFHSKEQQRAAAVKKRKSTTPKQTVAVEERAAPIITKQSVAVERAAAEIEPREEQRRSYVYTVLNEHSHSTASLWYQRFIATIILLDVIFFVLGTDKIVRRRLPQNFFHVGEGITSCLFAVEYLARLWTCTERPKYGRLGPVYGRLAYATTWPALIDLSATLPFFLELGTGWTLPRLTYLRVLRLFRILKTNQYVRAFDAVYRVIYYNREILWVAVLLCLFLILVTAVLLYYLRPPHDQADADFASILGTLYLSTLMLTGQGGPDGDLPWYTKCVVLLTAVFSVAMFAIPASMLTWGFEAEAQRMAKLARRRALRERSVTTSTSTTDWSDEDDDDSTDEEYFRIIAGEDGDSDASETDDPRIRQLKESFLQADRNADGTLTLREFLALQQQRDLADSTATATSSSQLSQRIEVLESRVQSNSVKLDRILELLEQR